MWEMSVYYQEGIHSQGAHRGQQTDGSKQESTVVCAHNQEVHAVN